MWSRTTVIVPAIAVIMRFQIKSHNFMPTCASMTKGISCQIQPIRANCGKFEPNCCPIQVAGRTKSLFSTMKKLLRLDSIEAGGRAPQEVHDILASRCIVTPHPDLPVPQAEEFATQVSLSTTQYGLYTLCATPFPRPTCLFDPCSEHVHIISFFPVCTVNIHPVCAYCTCKKLLPIVVW